MKKALNSIVATLCMMAAASNLYAAEIAAGKGTVNSVDAARATVNISHEAIPSLKWPGMTMDFKTADKKLLTGIKNGQTVNFGLIKDPAAGYVISRIESAK